MILRQLFLFLPFSILTLVDSKTSFDLNLCGKGQEFLCLIRDTCKHDADQRRLLPTTKGALNYQSNCDLHLVLKQHNDNTYFFRFITTKQRDITLTLQMDGVKRGKKENRAVWAVSCDWDDRGRHFLVNHNSTDVDVEQISRYDSNLESERKCEMIVKTKQRKIFDPDVVGYNTKLLVKYGGSSQELSYDSLETLKTEAATTSHRCDKALIKFSGDGGDGYYRKEVNAATREVTCPSNYQMFYQENTTPMVEIRSMLCMKVDDTCNPEKETCEWAFFVRDKTSSKMSKVKDQKNFKAHCQTKTCKLCSDPRPKCPGGQTTCSLPYFSTIEDCHALTCNHLTADGQHIIQIGDEPRSIGKFECTKTVNDPVNPVHEWTYNGKAFAAAACHDKMLCNEHSQLDLTEEAFLKENEDTGDISCTNKSKLIIHPVQDEPPLYPGKIQCDSQSGEYFYAPRKKTSRDARILIPANTTVSCEGGAKPSSALVSSSFPIWQIATCAAVVVVVILLIVLICWLRQRIQAQRLADKERRTDMLRSAMRRSESSQPASEPMTLVLCQPLLTAAPKSNPAPPSSHSSVRVQSTSEPIQVMEEKIPNEVSNRTMNTALTNSVSHQGTSKTSREMASDMNLDKAKRTLKTSTAKSANEKTTPTVRSRTNLTAVTQNSNTKLSEKMPQKFELNEKEKIIAKGLWRRNEDYPTMADIESDWDDKKDGKRASTQNTGTSADPTRERPETASSRARKRNEEIKMRTAELSRLLDDNESKPGDPNSKKSKTKEDTDEKSKSGTKRSKKEIKDVKIETTQDQKT